MNIRSQFAGLYKKDMSVDDIRTKVARRKSMAQKENRHKEFRRSRGRLLADVNISLVKEQDMTVLEEVNESYYAKTKPDTDKTKELITNERRAMLLRYQEEKKLRKLKQQREQASKGVFKCGIYKAETSFIPVLSSQNAVKAKQKEKPAAPCVTRVTRSAAKTEPPVIKTRTQQVSATVLKVSAERAITRSRGQNSTVKKNEKENKVSAIPPARSTRSTTTTASKLSTTVKVPLKNTAVAVAKSQKKITTKEDVVLEKTEPPVINQSNNQGMKQDIALKDTVIESLALAETSVLEQERKPSFAPQNFVFQPLDGLSALKFQPITPNRADTFLTPSFTWSPMESKRSFMLTRDHPTEENDIDKVSPTQLSPKATDVKLDTDFISSPQVKECTSEASSAVAAGPARTPPSSEPSAHFTEADNKSAQPEQSQHDVPYFRDTLKVEIQRLELMCSEWGKRIDMDIPDDAKDLVRTTVGQTRLLISERFKQFEGLVDHCEFKTGEKETTCTDLEGFWDMIYFQIEDVCKKFVNLGKLEENCWQQNVVQTKKAARKKIAPTTTAKQNQGDHGRAAAKSRLAAIKAAMKNKRKTEEPVSDAAAPELPMQVEPVVFDAGFFRIESPAKLPSSNRRTNRSSSRMSITSTSRSIKKLLPNSGNLAINSVEESMESTQAQKSPIRKALFGAGEKSLQNQETTVVTYADNAESDTVPQVVDLTKYLVPSENIEVGLKESAGLMECLGLETSDTSAVVDDVFMCSPEKVVDGTESSSSLFGSPKIVPDEEVQTTNDPLDFLGSCTPIMVTHTPLTLQSAVDSDLMVFSPLEEK
ncbi:disks large-associated protein 5 isoform X2 [Mixophyes fleayi]|uniref:disks large-associated protein 5 isoform X2 n=1 Tax=Mixophyes fleayi TaxID=3061075 RepID=UPI003F4D7183